MEVTNIFSALIQAPVDPDAGIRLIKMTGDTAISIYAAEIDPNTELLPHYHLKGIETYQVLAGKGLMKTGELKGESFEWTNSFEAIEGDCFSIPEKVVHQIINHMDEKLRLIFSCPESHVGSDRYFV